MHFPLCTLHADPMKRVLCVQTRSLGSLLDSGAPNPAIRQRPNVRSSLPLLTTRRLSTRLLFMLLSALWRCLLLLSCRLFSAFLSGLSRCFVGQREKRKTVRSEENTS